MPREQGRQIVAQNKKARHDYHIDATYEAGLVLVGTAAGYVEGARSYVTEAVAPDTIVIHGDRDETVPLANVLAWAEPLELAVSVVPGADHFFHRKLHVIRRIIESQWKP